MHYEYAPEKSDVVSVSVTLPGKESEVDEWGCIWDKLGGRVKSSLGQVKIHPLSSWNRLNSYLFPDFTSKGIFTSAREVVAKYPTKYIIGGIGISGFNRMMLLRGFENLMIDFYRNRSNVDHLIEKVSEVEVAKAEGYHEAGVDGVFFADDWGTQQGLMISQAMWRVIFKSKYKRQFDSIKHLGIDIWFESCGKVIDIIPDLIEIGVDALHLEMPKLIGIDCLEKYAGKVCFDCPVDTQTTLVKGTPEEIRNEVEYLVKALSRPEGGFIACCDTGKDWGEAIPEENIRLMAAAFEALARRLK